ncbi:MAG TPA: PfkB family carbohydrate kinase [Pyrinomonadaceae bacterium]|nr:PfkB family carbohydrate kinase [Pyrinomonadaceae bacterium]
MEQSLNHVPTVLCFGEVLWDCLPEGMYAGGAPLNVAYHLRRQGLDALPVTAVGRDELGARLRQLMGEWGMGTNYVGVDEDHPTGVVQVTLGPEGGARYEIVEDVAWDHIAVTPDLLAASSGAAALVFGTLAARSARNRAGLTRLREAAGDAWKIYDVNLRPPYDDHELVRELARDVDLIKLNDAELGALTGREVTLDSIAAVAATFALSLACPRMCVTAGPQGAGLLAGGEWFWAHGRPIATKDTVGAGDAFLASLIAGLLVAKGTPPAAPPQEILERACRLGEFVAASDGATPFYQLDEAGEIRAE